MKKTCILGFVFFISSLSKTLSQNITDKGFGPLPTKEQLQWHDKEFYLFMHFGPNTFTDLEWGHGSEDPNVFNPTAIDCRQWARIAKKAGAKGIVITAKHHDGFCLWPSKFSTHTVRESKWMDGKGDVIKMLSEACKAEGIEMGVYISPWDRNHPKYGTPEYNDIYIQTMKELLTGYGNFFELWWDGANGEGPNGKKQVYDFTRFKDSALSYQPKIQIFSDIGPHIRWVGNENGFIHETNWNLLDTMGFKRGEGAPPNDTLNRGNYNGHHWIGAEADVSIKPGWFYHPNEASKVKSAKTLFDIYLHSVGHGGNLILNVPPNRMGLITPEDSASLIEFKKLRDSAFAENLLSKSNKLVTYNGFTYTFKKPTTINAVTLKEKIALGQRVSSFEILGSKEQGKYFHLAKGTTIGHKRIVSFPATELRYLQIVIKESKAKPIISSVEAFLINN